MVGQQVLALLIGVQIPVPEQNKNGALWALFLFCFGERKGFELDGSELD